MTNTFLQADWRKLVMFNYAVDTEILQPFLPAGTEFDFWNNTCYVSLVGFMFQNTRLLGVKIPLHTNFEEVNLRFYVRYKAHGLWKRGVVFIKEIVPRPALTFVANTVYKEHYEILEMAHLWQKSKESLTVAYRWKKASWNSIKIQASLQTNIIKAGSEEEFIMEHYWGYTRLNPTSTSEYKVEHPIWLSLPIFERPGPGFGFSGRGI
jgi:uncharacterized protein YqjF (DUF2071 family)